MPSWKKVITSGSDASLASLFVANAVTSSIFSGSRYIGASFTGSFSGSVAAPGSNTNIIYNSSGVLAGSTNFIFDGTNVGIGTTTPSSNLDIRGASDTVGQISLQLRSGNTSVNFNSNQITFGYANTALYRHAIKTRHNSDASSGNAIDFYTWLNGSATTAIGGQHVMSLNGANVGIGTTTPQTGIKLDVSGSAAIAGGTEGLRLGNIGDNSSYDNIKIYYTGYNSAVPRVYLTPRTTPGSGIVNTYFHLLNSNGTSTTSNNTMGLLVDGSVGIGTTAPDRKLSVSGSIGAYVGNNEGAVSITVGEGTTGPTGNIISLETNSTSNTTRIYNTGTSTSLNIGSTGTTSDVSLSSVRDLYFKVNNGGDVFAGTTALYVSSSTNIGIGTTNPIYKLHSSGIINSDGGYVNSQATFTKSYSLGNIAANTTYTLGQLDFGSVYTHHFRVRVSSYAGTKTFDFIGYQAGLSKTVSGVPYQQDRFNTLDVVLEKVVDGSNQITGVKIGIKNGYAGDDFIYSATIECLSVFSNWTALASNTTLTTFTPGVSNYVIAEAGSVGIGTTSPATTLDVIGNVRATSFTGSFSGSVAAAGSNTQIIYNNAGVLAGSSNLVFNGSNVGIGTTGPLQLLHINGSILLDGITNGYTQAATRGIGYGSNNGAVSTDGFSGMDIQSVNAPAPNNQNYSQNLRFWTHHYGTGTGNTPRMVIQYNGNVGIGSVSPAYPLDVNGTVRVTTLIETSTKILKENIQPYSTDINKFKKLKPVSFNWKDTKKEDVGLIAEDLNKVFPEFVSKDDGKPVGIHYGKLAAIFINVIKEQQERIEALEKQVKKLIK